MGEQREKVEGVEVEHRNSEQEIQETPRSETEGFRRREFLQVGFLGAAASALGVGTAEAQSVARAQGAAGEGEAAKPLAACQALPSDQRKPLPPDCVLEDLQGAGETWNEPWVWRPGDWPGQQLDLNVVLNQNPGIEVGLGNPGSVFFSYGGDTPGPTIRMRGDETLSVKLRNLLGEDCGQTFIGPFPDLGDFPDQNRVHEVKLKATRRRQRRFDFCLGEHTNGLHSAHVTNLHTHGLHVRPDKNPDGTHSDNVILRVLSQGDFKRRERAALDQRATCVCGNETDLPTCEKCGSEIAPTPACGVDVAADPNDPSSACQFLRNPDQIYLVQDDEVVGQADYEFRLGNLPNFPVHPPGTHWYHPHAHGATDIQVSSGMAGFLIVEGDVDESLGCALTGSEHPDPAIKTGPWEYRERLMFMQRVFPGNIVGDPDSPVTQLKKVPVPSANGSEKAGVINMRPGAIERWRFINGSVDGRGYKRVMVLRGRYDIVTTGYQSNGAAIAPLFKVEPPTGSSKPKLEEVTFANYDELIEGAKCPVYQLAIDGVTLVKEDEKTGEAKYFIKDLSLQGKGTKYPPSQPCSDPQKEKFVKGRPNAEKLCRIESVFENGESIKNTWVRPNEFYMGPANRTDFLFQLPLDAKCGEVFTVLAKAAVVHADTPVFNLQNAFDEPDPAPGPEDIIVAHVVVVDETPVPGVGEARKMGADPRGKIMSLNGCLPPAPPYLAPVTAEELKDDRGKVRSRIVNYSGWGNDGLPLVTTEGHEDPKENPTAKAFHDFIQSRKGKELRDLRYTEFDDVEVLLAPRIRTMSINGRKFNPNDPKRFQVLVNTCEQWVLYNTTQTLWAHTDMEKHPQKGQYNKHFKAFPIDRKTGEDEFWTEKNLGDGPPDFKIVTRGIDHPFHIHQNPFWVLRIEIPDQNGELHNILDEPRWMDSLWIPRNAGRVVFRSRFPDFVGASVHHCHILQHEDNGMMTSFQLTPFPALANDEKWDCVVDENGVSGYCADENLGRPSLDDAYGLNFNFVDPNLPHGASGFVPTKGAEDGPDTGQVYPGFKVTPPEFKK